MNRHEIDSFMKLMISEYDISEKNDRQEIYSFIKSRMDKYDFDRGYASEYIGDNYINFLRYNEDQAMNISVEELTFVTFLKNRIQNGYISNMDKNSMIPFQASGFAWNPKNGQLIIFNER